MSIDQVEFRQALGLFASGVTIITTQHENQPHGTTVSAFSSLSLNPPLVLVSIDINATIHDLLIASEVFAVNILAEHAETTSRHFARRIPDKFNGITYTLGELNVPLLEDAIASLQCRLVARYPGGDHSIFVGEVLATRTHPAHRPLLYFRSQYERLYRETLNLVTDTISPTHP